MTQNPPEKPLNATQSTQATHLAHPSIEVPEPALTPYQLEQNRVAMVISSGTSCIAKNSFGHRVDITTAECLQYSHTPKLIEPSYLPRDFSNQPAEVFPASDTSQPLDTSSFSSLDVA